MKAISFSLFVSDARNAIGAMRNADLDKKFFPE